MICWCYCLNLSMRACTITQIYIRKMMECHRFCFIILAVCTFSYGVVSTEVESRQPTPVTVDVDSSRVLFQVDPRLYSFGLGCSLHYKNHYNLSSPILRSLSKELAPAYLRLGGTYCDFLTFEGEAREEYSKTFSNKTLTGEMWDELNSFVEDVGFQLVFDINVLLRTPENKWDPSNLEQLLDYNSKKGHKVNFQLGNEPNAFRLIANISITPEALADDFKTLRTILKQRKLYQESLLIGPDTTSLVKHMNSDAKEYLQQFLDNIGDAVDVVSTHFYYRPLSKAEPVVNIFTDPSVLDQFLKNTVAFKELVERHDPPNRPKLWYGETGLLPGGFFTVGGSGMNYSDRFISGMVQLDKLGICASHGIEVMVRQTLLGPGHRNGRRLITDDYDPNPDYWSVVLYKRLVGVKSLKVTKFAADTDGINRVRLYAHCTQTDRSKYGYKPGAVTVFGVNFSQQKPVQLLFNSNSVDQFLLTPARTSNITSKYIALNGHELSAIGGAIPDLPPQQVSAKPLFPAGSMGFFVLKDAGFKICKT
ncbi:heparanase-like isoform X3 [Apostichopus japonicus]|uniref:heparanase-like isoform X3 n=1 Tax=Stichopus japonicus TaxID=307972 RepID=UPI003AB32C50